MLKLEDFFSYSPDPMFIINREANFEMVNTAFCNLLGCKPKEFPGKQVIKFIHPDDRDLAVKHMQHFFEGNSSKSQELEIRFVAIDGNLKNLLWVKSFIGDGMLYIIAHDHTEFRKKKNETEDLRNKLLRIIDMVPHPIFLKDNDGRYVMVNEAQASLYSRSKDDLLGKDDSDFICLDEELRLIKESDEKVLKKRVTTKIPEQVLSYRNGTVKILHTIKVPFINRDNEVNILGVSINLSELKEAENELKRINFELDNFVYHASHDIKAPLCSLLGLLNLMEIEKDPVMKEVCILEARKSISRLSDFINDLIDYSRNNRTKLECRPVNFNEIIKDCLGNLRYLDGLSRMKKIFKIQDNLHFFTDEVRVRTILANCISNSIKYQDRLKEESILSVKISQRQNNLCITISDNGIGIDEMNQDKIFDMFYRATERSSGSGLGLYIVRQVVEKLKGTLFVKSRQGKGTIFTVILPDLRIAEKKETELQLV